MSPQTYKLIYRYLLLIHTHTQQFAKTHWLPDYQSSDNQRVNDGGAEEIDCSSKGKVTCSSPFQGVGTPEMISGQKCYNSCTCINKSDCNSTFNFSSPPANANYSSCREINASCSVIGNRYKISSCKNGYELKSNSCLAKACPSGFTAGLKSCPNTTDNYETNGYSGNLVCGKCTNTCSSDYKYDTCPIGAVCSETCGGKHKIESCQTDEGYQLSGGNCVSINCPAGFTAGVEKCDSGFDFSSNGKSGGKICGKCVNSCRIDDGWSTTIPATCTEHYASDTQCGEEVYKCKNISANITNCDELLTATKDNSYLEYNLLNNITCNNVMVSLPSNTKLLSDAPEGRSIMFTFDDGKIGSQALTMQNGSTLDKVNIKVRRSKTSGGGNSFRGQNDAAAIYIPSNAKVTINQSKIMLTSTIINDLQAPSFVAGIRLDDNAILDLTHVVIKFFSFHIQSVGITAKSSAVINMDGSANLLAISLNEDMAKNWGITGGTLNMKGRSKLLVSNNDFADLTYSLYNINLNMNDEAEAGFISSYRGTNGYYRLHFKKLAMRGNSRIYYNDLAPQFRATAIIAENLTMNDSSKINVWADGRALMIQKASEIAGTAQINIKTKDSSDHSPLMSSEKLLFKGSSRLIIEIVNPVYVNHGYEGKVSFAETAKTYSKHGLCKNADTYVSAGVEFYYEKTATKCSSVNSSPITVINSLNTPEGCKKTRAFDYGYEVPGDFVKLYKTGFNNITAQNTSIDSNSYPFTNEWPGLIWSSFIR